MPRGLASDKTNFIAGKIDILPSGSLFIDCESLAGCLISV
jgi:hypothetical protein